MHLVLLQPAFCTCFTMKSGALWAPVIRLHGKAGHRHKSNLHKWSCTTGQDAAARSCKGALAAKGLGFAATRMIRQQMHRDVESWWTHA